MTISSNARATQQRAEAFAEKSNTPVASCTDSNIASAQFQHDCSSKVPDYVPENPLEGWPTVAEMMASNPEFRNLCRFSDLNMKSLLYYQAELFHLRKELHKHEYYDFRHAEKDSDAAEFFSCANFLVDSQNEKTHKQWDLVVKIRKVLKEYNDALLQYTEVSKLPSPNPFNVDNFRLWLHTQTVTDRADPRYGFYNIEGDGEQHIWGNIWDNPRSSSLLPRFALLLWHLFFPKIEPKQDLDLVSTSPKTELDFLTRWVMHDYIPFYNDLKKQDWFKSPTAFLISCYTKRKERIKASRKKSPEDVAESGSSSPISLATTALPSPAFAPSPKRGALVSPKPPKSKAYTVSYYSSKSILRFTSGIATIIACLLPTVAIAVLSKIHSTGQRLGAIAGFTALFAAGLMCLTPSGTSRVEIFTATAAFSAVMVVFVQNT